MNRSLNFHLIPFLRSVSLRRGAIFGAILIAALLSFEVFNFGTTSFALGDVFGNLEFAGMRWATILAFAFCAIDFAGIARLFTPEQGRDEPVEVYYLFGAWLLAAAFNAMLTWWGISVAIQNHNAQGGALLGEETMTNVVPVFVAGMVWLIRVLIIGTFAIAGERLFTLADVHDRYAGYRNQPVYSTPQSRTVPPGAREQVSPPVMPYPRPAPKPRPAPASNYGINRPEPTYHPIGMSAMSREQDNPSIRR
jgi:hypothetical protein